LDLIVEVYCSTVLFYRPNGSLIATSLRRPNKHDIAFFEKNGLRHGEFTLPFGVEQVKVSLCFVWKKMMFI